MFKFFFPRKSYPLSDDVEKIWTSQTDRKYNTAQNSCRMTRAKNAYITHSYISYLLLRNALIPSDLVKCFTAAQKLRNYATIYLSLRFV